MHFDLISFLLGYVAGVLSFALIVFVLHKRGRAILPPPVPTLRGRYVFDGSKHVYVEDRK